MPRTVINSRMQPLPDNIHLLGAHKGGGQPDYMSAFNMMARALEQPPVNVAVWNSPWSEDIPAEREAFFAALSEYMHKRSVIWTDIRIEEPRTDAQFDKSLSDEFNCLAQVMNLDMKMREQLDLWRQELAALFKAAQALLGQTHQLNLEIRLKEQTFVKTRVSRDAEHVDGGRPAIEVGKRTRTGIKDTMLRFIRTEYGPGTFFVDRNDVKYARDADGYWSFDGYRWASLLQKPPRYHMRTGAVAMFAASDWPLCAPAVHGTPLAADPKRPEPRIVTLINCMPRR